MAEWWNDLLPRTRHFYTAATFFSVFFIWQLISALIGIGGDDMDADGDGADVDGDATYDDFEQGAESDATETLTSFKVLSIRSIITFFTLFTWGAALYMTNGLAPVKAISLGLLWGLAGMFVVALLFYMLKKLSESGNMNLNTCVGSNGTVYLDIPADGTGEIKVSVSNVMTHVKARSADGEALAAGTLIQVTRRTGQNYVEVKKI